MTAMREIKFRGRDTNGNWHYGDLLRYVRDSYDMIIPAGHANSDDLYDDVVCVDYDTVGQYTGLLDYKGNEIFEGDILKKRDELAWRTVDRGVVFWHNSECRWCVKMRDGLVFSLTSRKSDTWRVIGNVHDNSGLLEDEKDA